MPIRKGVGVPLLFFVFASIACSLPLIDRLSEAEPTPTSLEDTTTIAVGPTSTPLPPIAPTLVEVEPAPGEELGPYSPITLYFDQPMDTASVEAAIKMVPFIQADLSWIDESTLRYAPSEPLNLDSKYHLTIEEEAKSLAGLSLKTAIQLPFKTAGYLKVTQVNPPPGTFEVNPSTTITVVFNRPVVPLQIEEDSLQPLTFDPQISGEGEWVGTSIYHFRPDDPFPGGTSIRVRVEAGLEDVGGGQLVEAYEWSFYTSLPSVISIDPVPEERDVPLDQALRITFNQIMDPIKTQQAFSLETDDGPVSGSFEWEEDGTILLFQPSLLLDYNQRYSLSLTQEAQNPQGTPLSGELLSTFNTILRPEVTLTSPQQGGIKSYNKLLSITFSTPMNEASIVEAISITPGVENFGGFWRADSKQWAIYGDFEPATSYLLSLDDSATDIMGTSIQEPFLLRFSTSDMPPHLSFIRYNEVLTLTSFRPPQVDLQVRNLSSLDLNLYRLSLDQFFSLLRSSNYSYPEPTPVGELLQQWSQPVSTTKNVTEILKVPLQPGDLVSGPYMLIVDSPDDPDAAIVRLLVVRDVELVIKSTVEEALIWAVDLSEGQPISEYLVRLYANDGVELGRGQTNIDGVLELNFSRLEDPYDRIFAVAGSPGEPGFGFTASTWTDGISSYEFGIWMNPIPQDAKVYLYTDRPIYRPGHIVHFRGVIRDIRDDLYQLPQETTLSVSLQDPGGETILSQSVTISVYGTFQGQFQLNQEADIGEYRIQTEQGSVYFEVAAYRKPEFTVSVTPSAEDVAAGDSFTAKIEAEFFFGGPVAGAEVKWIAYATPIFPIGIPQSINWFSRASLSYPFISFNTLASGESMTDAEGQLTIDIPTSLDNARPLQVVIEATLTESSGLPITGSGSFYLHPSTVYLSLTPDRYAIRVGETALIRLGAFDWDGNPLPGQLAQIDVERILWSQVVSSDGRVTYESQATLVNQANLTTAEGGSVLFSFLPEKSGTYKVRARGLDASDREATTELTIWVSGQQNRIWRQPSAERIVLVPDYETYSPGDVVKIFVPSPFNEPVEALVTVERRGVISHQILTLEGSDSILEIPIETSHIPNIFISVVLIRPASQDKPEALAVGLVELDISAKTKQLDVQLTNEPTTAEPGGTVEYDLQVTDWEGNPVQAEFSLALVDLAVLSLMDPNSPSPYAAFYAHRNLGVRTGASLSLRAEGLSPVSGPEGIGGGGGSPIPLEVRSEFPDTAYWNPSVITDAEGRAHFSISLPDSLTTWRLDVRGVNTETIVGSAIVDVISTKELLIRPVTPRFFTAGDAASVAAVVHNRTDHELSVEVHLSASGAEITDPLTQRTSIPPGGHKRVEWRLVVQDVDGVDLAFYVSGGGLEDASKPTIGSAQDGILPVLRYSAPNTSGTAGELEGAGTLIEAVSLPRTFDGSQGKLLVTLDPSLGSAVNTALNVLEGSSYESTEQLISRFLPNLLTYRALQDLGIGDPASETRLERILEESLQTLYIRQNPDGGWGWWRSSPSDTYLTAYSIFALSQAEAAGVSIKQDILDPAIQFLRAGIFSPSLATQPNLLNRQSFVLYVLAKAGKGDLLTTTQMASYHENLSLWARALIANTLSILDPGATELRTLLSDLESQAIRSATGTHWQEEVTDYWNLESGVKTTAHVLNALLSIDPSNNTIPGAIRWLLASRTQDGTWNSSHETAWALMGLVEWLKASGSLDSDYEYSLQLNGNILASGKTSEDALFSSIELITPIHDLYAEQPNQISIQRGTGDGSLYYTAHLTVYRPAEDIAASSRGLSVHREYFKYDGTCGEIETPCPKADSARVGDDVLVRISLIVPSDQYYIILEDPFPAGMEPIQSRQHGSLLDPLTFDESIEADTLRSWGWWYFSHVELGDDRLKLYADYLPAGTYQYTYQLHALFPGEYRILPTRAWLIYFPEIYGQSVGEVVSIKP